MSVFGSIGFIWRRYGWNSLRFLPVLADNARVFLKSVQPRKGPVALVFNAGKTCNAKCPFCDYWKEPAEKESDLDPGERLEVIRKAAEAGVRVISFCAAEPLLMEDIFQLVSEARQHRMMVNISSNGYFLADKADLLRDLGVDTITVSVDSHVPLIHDRMRKCPGLYNRIVSGAAKIMAMKGKRPRLAVRHLLSAENCYSLSEFVRCWGEKCDDIVLKPISVSRDGRYSVPEHMRIEEDQYSRFRDYLSKVLTEHPRLDDPYHRALPEYIFGGGTGRHYCFAGTFYADVDRGGDLYPCAEFDEKIGNVIEDGFMPVWTSDKLREFRKSLKARKKCSDCWGDKFRNGIYVQKLVELMGGII